jgi:hypothetical protein
VGIGDVIKTDCDGTVGNREGGMVVARLPVPKNPRDPRDTFNNGPSLRRGLNSAMLRSEELRYGEGTCSRGIFCVASARTPAQANTDSNLSMACSIQRYRDIWVVCEL